MIIRGNALSLPLASASVQCVVTSPPYWGLRKYAGEQEIDWSGWRGAYGLEPTVEMYVDHSVQILREVRRVLRKDGVCFWNVGDSYCGSWGNFGARDSVQRTVRKERFARDAWEDHNGKPPMANPQISLKPKDLCLIPFRVALAAQADGWWVRSVIIWAKPNPMPESVRDRPTDAYEHILMLTKSERYFWDAEAAAEELKRPDEGLRKAPARFGGAQKHELMKDQSRYWSGNEYTGTANGKRNLRNVWTFPTQPYPEAHFATFPEELPRRCIKAASKPGDVVLDPFGGSGTTARVALELNRLPISVDLAYQGLARKRTKNVQRQLLAVSS